MKLPSFRSALAEGQRTLARFPLVIADAVLGTAVALILIDVEGPPRPTILFPLLLASLQGIPLLLVCALVAERRRLAGSRKAALHAAGVLLLAAYALTVPLNLPDAPALTLIRFAFLAAALHLLAAWAPFAERGETTGFWQFNRILFARVLMSALFSFILWAGLAIALEALQHLFGVNIPGKRYGELWVLVTGVFATWFFLAGVPDDLAALDRVAEYPRWISVFARYVLLPLVLVYLLILYAYIVKIVAAWAWPEGWVSRLIIGLACAGIFSQLLLHPSVEAAPGGWTAKFSRWFSLLLIPLSCVLALALSRRVSEYGVTEGRYTALVIAAWLACISVYCAVRRRWSIKVVPLSLCLVALAVSAGPWGAFDVSERSQVGRLRGMLERDSLLVGGSIRPAGPKFPAAEGSQITATLGYLHDVHGYDGIQGWFSEPLARYSAGRGKSLLTAQEVGDLLRITRSPWVETTFTPAEPASYDVRGYTRIAFLRVDALRDTVELAGDIRCTMDSGGATVRFRSIREGSERDLLAMDVGAHALRLLRRYGRDRADTVSPPELSLTAEGDGLRVRLCPWRLECRHDGEAVEIIAMDATIAYTGERDR